MALIATPGGTGAAALEARILSKISAICTLNYKSNSNKQIAKTHRDQDKDQSSKAMLADKGPIPEGSFMSQASAARKAGSAMPSSRRPSIFKV